MDYYFSAANDAAALVAMELPAGPVPGSPGFDSVEAKDVLACPHLEQLVGIATGRSGPSLVPQLRVLWPEPPAAEDSFEFVPGASIMRLPDSLRDDLTGIELTSAVAEGWAAELWGFEPNHARNVAEDLIRLAKAARTENRSIYRWSEM